LLVKKLVRDNIPAIVGKSATVVRENEYARYLANKLVEEALELKEAKTNMSLREELADVLEVFYAMLERNGLSFEEIENARRDKRAAKGGFAIGYVMEFPEPPPHKNPYFDMLKRVMELP
jgi:predicted house-cleaning noncanonical NTP pyrophosphatase (MazG superfamily)